MEEEEGEEGEREEGDHTVPSNALFEVSFSPDHEGALQLASWSISGLWTLREIAFKRVT